MILGAHNDKTKRGAQGSIFEDRWAFRCFTPKVDLTTNQVKTNYRERGFLGVICLVALSRQLVSMFLGVPIFYNPVYW